MVWKSSFLLLINGFVYNSLYVRPSPKSDLQRDCDIPLNVKPIKLFVVHILNFENQKMCPKEWGFKIINWLSLFDFRKPNFQLFAPKKI